MTDSAMSSSICKALHAFGYEQIKGGSEYKRFNKEFIDAIAKGVVEEIKANAKAIDTNSQHGGKWSIE